jgi:dTDP-glucose pyrophosphorylase
VLIENWKAEPGNTEHWAMVFEALLRCGGNMTIPGTDDNSRKYRRLAADMGLWITHHHAEPLGAEMFARVYPDDVPSYPQNRALFEKLWEQAVIEQKDYKVIWNLGFRGQGDYPFWNDDPEYVSTEQRGALISEIINRQYEIIKLYIKNPLCCTNLYGEITGLYQSGNMCLPPGIIKIWADNGYGCMVSRRQGNDNPRIYALPKGGDTGPHGIYYHCSFYDLQASNHLTMSPNKSEFLAAELGKVLVAGANAYWIINCGSLKPHVYALDLIRCLWQHGEITISEWPKSYARTYYGKNAAEFVAALFEEYALCTAKYGPNDDDRAGEEIWHYPVRELLCKWMSGDTGNGLKSLMWLAGDMPFYDQAQKLEKIARETFPKWDRLCEKCAALRFKLDTEYISIFDDSIFLQVRLQRSGSLGTALFCESLNAYRAGDMVNAFRLASKSRDMYDEGVKALLDAGHGKWTGYYEGDCLTDIRLTVSCMDALVSWLRVCGDGPGFHGWERAFLVPAGEKAVRLLLHKKRPLDNACLAECLEETKNVKKENMQNPLLVILAAGMGSRYGGLKQIDRIGKGGEVLMDYSVYDALKSGFRKVVFIIRHDMEKDFKEVVLGRMGSSVSYELAFQEPDNLIPSELFEYAKKTGRTKPWGTLHALLCAAPYIDSPFAVINADDFYGRDAYKVMGAYLSVSNLNEGAIVPYKLERTLSPKGSVTRGVCGIEGDYLISVDELKSIEKQGSLIFNTGLNGIRQELSADTPVSMNFWGFPPKCLPDLRRYFDEFLESSGKELKSECYIPLAADWLIKNNLLKIKILPAKSEWFGVTYQEDREQAERRIAELTETGEYPACLWE